MPSFPSIQVQNSCTIKKKSLRSNINLLHVSIRITVTTFKARHICNNIENVGMRCPHCLSNQGFIPYLSLLAGLEKSIRYK